MQKPQDSLDEFFNRTEPIAPAPPPAVSLRPTGEFETLKPLARWEWPAIPPPVSEQLPVQHASFRVSWFHRSLVFGGGVAVIALIFLSAIFTAISERPDQAAGGNADTPVYTDDMAFDDGPALVEEAAPDIFKSMISPRVFGELLAPRRVVRPRRVRHRVYRAVYKPRRFTPGPKTVISDFVPTTLIIYAENGEVKTRIEPNLTAVYKRPTSITN